jgi:hypothetical protein
MAYEQAFGAPKIYKHSNPDLTCLGVPCGVESSDVDDGADAVTSLNAVRTQLEAYRAAVTPVDPLDFAPPGDVGEPAGVIEAELRLLSPRANRRRIRTGKVVEIEWAASEVASVDIHYRESWREGASDFIAREWTLVGEGLSEGRFSWTVPAFTGRKVRLQLRLVGRDAAGREVASYATRTLRVKRGKR